MAWCFACELRGERPDPGADARMARAREMLAAMRADEAERFAALADLPPDLQDLAAANADEPALKALARDLDEQVKPADPAD